MELVSKFDVDGVKAVAVSVIPFKFKNVNQKHVVSFLLRGVLSDKYICEIVRAKITRV